FLVPPKELCDNWACRRKRGRMAIPFALPVPPSPALTSRWCSHARKAATANGLACESNGQALPRTKQDSKSSPRSRRAVRVEGPEHGRSGLRLPAAGEANPIRTNSLAADLPLFLA